MFFRLSRNVALSLFLRSASFAFVACFATPSVAADELEALYIPPSAGQAAIGWGDCVRRCEPSVMLVGDPGHSRATAFVISSKHRLLATNAHVADDFFECGTMTALANGTTTTYTVDRVWYHPGVVRKHDHFLAMRCQDPSHGEVLAGCPDVAVLHLADGPELPAELTFATPEELNELFAQPVAMLGFPSCDQQSRWPAAGEKSQASFREGTVNRLNPLNGTSNRDSRELKAVQYSIGSWFGASGSPVFLPNGHVVAINEGLRVERHGPHVTELASGIRVDCLWELLAYHNLTDQVPIPVSTASLNLARYREVDPSETRCHLAMELVDRCDRLMLMSDFQLAQENCNQALLLAPGYAHALRVRGNVLRECVGAQGGSLSRDRKLELLNKASEDIGEYVKKVPDDPWGIIDDCWTRLWIEWVRTGNLSNSQVQSQLTRLLEASVLDPRQRAYALCVRAAANSYHPNCGADLDEAVRLAPYGIAGAMAHNHRASWLQQQGQLTAATGELRQADEQIEAERLVAKAQDTLERPDSTDEDLRVAFDLLLRAGRGTDFCRWQHVLLMATIKHRLGDDIAATAWASKALALAPDSRKARIRLELAGYSSAAGQIPWTTCYGPDGPRTYAVERPLQPVGFSGQATGAPHPSRLSLGSIHGGEN